MSTFGEDMLDLAVEINEEFSEELGMCTFRHFTGGSAYNPTTGVVTPAYTDYSMLITFDSLSNIEMQDAAYRSEHRLAYVAGRDLAIEPKKNDVIIDQSSEEHLITFIDFDQYGANYKCHVKRLNDDTP